MEENTSGYGEKAVVPNELKGGWNWGAFLLNWIWGIGNNTFIAFLCWVPFVNIVMPFVLGAKGNEWAWRNKRWDSVEHFKRVQRTWSLWGIGLFVVSLLFIIAMTIVMVIFAAKYDNNLLGKFEQKYEQSTGEDESSAVAQDSASDADAEDEGEDAKLARTPAFGIALGKVGSDEKLMAKLGDNAEYKNLTGSADDNSADYTFTVAGDKAGGTVHATASNKDGKWVIESLTIDMGNGKPINLNK